MWLRTYPPLWDDDSSPVSSEASWLATHSRVPRSASKVSMIVLARPKSYQV